MLQRSHDAAPWFAITTGRLAVAVKLVGQEQRAASVLAEMGPQPRPMWGRVAYHLAIGELDAAAHSRWSTPTTYTRGLFINTARGHPSPPR